MQRLAEGIGRLLEKRGLIERDAQPAWLSGELDELLGHCITWRIAQPCGLPRHVAMRWAQRLKRVFGIEIESCARWGRSQPRRSGGGKHITAR